MGALISCLTGHNKDDNSGNENSSHNPRWYLLRKWTSMFRPAPTKSPACLSNQEASSSSPNEAAENSGSNQLQSFATAANSSISYLEIDGTATQKGGRLNCKEKPKQSQIGSSVPRCESQDECPTCLEGYSPENPKIVAKCSHHYHLGCIYDWMERSATCPICSKVMVFDETA